MRLAQLIPSLSICLLQRVNAVDINIQRILLLTLINNNKNSVNIFIFIHTFKSGVNAVRFHSVIHRAHSANWDFLEKNHDKADGILHDDDDGLGGGPIKDHPRSLCSVL